jgi:two-component system, NarL family, nitrate/nitrite response regulator NarL
MKQNPSSAYTQTFGNESAKARLYASAHEAEHEKSKAEEKPVESHLREVASSGTALIVEDHPLYRDALIRLLHVVLSGQNIASANSAEEGLRTAVGIADLRLVLLDVGLPGLSGIEAVTAFRQRCPAATLVVVSASEDRRDVSAAFRAGAHAFVSKAVSTDVLADVVRRVLAGAMSEPEWIVAAGTSDFVDMSMPTLTPRQREILTLLSQGYSNKEIGLRLDVAEVTVKLHVSSIFRVLGVTNRTQAVLAARRLALCPVDQSST